MKKTSRMIFIALLAAQAAVIYVVESAIPVPFIAPGAKLGLANVITCIALYTLSAKEAALVVLIRLLISTMLVGSVSSLMYSLGGAILSFGIMTIIKNLGKDKVSIIGVSCAGGVFHNVGQILVASAIVQNIWVTLYLPVLTAAGIGTGIFVGITANYAVKHISKLRLFAKNN